jgi:hypothetical protein
MFLRDSECLHSWFVVAFPHLAPPSRPTGAVAVSPQGLAVVASFFFVPPLSVAGVSHELMDNRIRKANTSGMTMGNVCDKQSEETVADDACCMRIDCSCSLEMRTFFVQYNNEK